MWATVVRLGSGTWQLKANTSLSKKLAKAADDTEKHALFTKAITKNGFGEVRQLDQAKALLAALLTSDGPTNVKAYIVQARQFLNNRRTENNALDTPDADFEEMAATIDALYTVIDQYCDKAIAAGIHSPVKALKE